MQFKLIPKRAGVLIAALVLVATAEASAGTSAVPSHQSDVEKARTVPAANANRSRTLDEEIHAGRVDPAVATTLHQRGTVNALVTFEFRSAVAGPSVALRAKARTAGLQIRRMTASFDRVKRRALTSDIAGVTVLEHWKNLPTAFVRIESPQALLELLRRPGVLSVSANERMRAQSQNHLNVVQQPKAAASGYLGAGTYVAVLDTGVNYNYADFGSCASGPGSAGCRVTYAADTTTTNDGSLDDSGHGSNVAAIVTQMAPGTRILAFDVFNGEWADVRAVSTALNTLIGWKAQSFPVVSANMSFGGGGSWGDCSATSAHAAIIQATRSAGIIPVVAAANHAGGGRGTVGVADPACVGAALTVGATYDMPVGAVTMPNDEWYSPGCYDAMTAQDQVTCFSQTSPSVDILAPGFQIQGAGGTYTGTSQAAPHVAGAVAVLAAAKPAATAAAIESALVSSGPLVSDSRFGTTINARRLAVSDAVNKLVSASTSTAPAKPTLSRQIAALTTLDSSARVAVDFKWSSTGATAYNVWVRQAATPETLNAATWVEDTTLSNSTNVRYLLQGGQTYQVAVRARNGAGPWSDYSYTTATVVIDDDPAWGTIPGWYRTAWSPSYGGTEINATAAGTWFNYPINGTDAAWVAPMFSTAGQSRVSHDGVDDGVFDQYSATLKSRQTVYSVHFNQPGDHNILIKVLGTLGRPQVDIDAFVVLR